MYSIWRLLILDLDMLLQYIYSVGLSALRQVLQRQQLHWGSYYPEDLAIH